MNKQIVPRQAPLPTSYIAAKTALGKCARVDECKSWADKALALKSYAKQMGDKSLHNYAERIQARAVKRGGQLLLQVKAARGGDRKSKGRQRPVDRKAAAEDAGLSPRQAKQMVRVAKVDDDQFEEMVERDDPATVTELAEAGTKKVVVKLTPEERELSDAWIEWISAAKHLATLPQCGLAVLAQYHSTSNHLPELQRECDAAINNLTAWRKALEEAGRIETCTPTSTPRSAPARAAAYNNTGSAAVSETTAAQDQPPEREQQPVAQNTQLSTSAEPTRPPTRRHSLSGTARISFNISNSDLELLDLFCARRGYANRAACLRALVHELMIAFKKAEAAYDTSPTIAAVKQLTPTPTLTAPCTTDTEAPQPPAVSPATEASASAAQCTTGTSTDDDLAIPPFLRRSAAP